MKKTGYIIFVLFLSAIFFSCKKDEKPVTNAAETQVTIHYAAYLNDYPLILNSNTLVVNQNGDSLNVTKFNYYITNVKLTRDNGSVYAEPVSYHLVSHEDPSSTSFTIKNLPEGVYTKMEFMIGVDSLHNISGSQEGALDPAHYMFWNWNTGYIFLKLEGKFKTAQYPAGNVYAMHTGGFKLPYNCIRNCVINLPPVNVADKTKPAVFFNVLIDEIFKNPVAIDLDSYLDVAGGQKSNTIATNYADMFTLNHVSN